MLEELVLEKKLKNIKIRKHEIFMLSEYHKNRTWKFLDGVPDENQITMKSDYDFLAWLSEDSPKPLDKYYVKKQGSTGKGVAPCIRNKYARIGQRVIESENIEFFKPYIWDEK